MVHSLSSVNVVCGLFSSPKAKMPEQKRLVMIMWETFKQSLRRTPRTAQFGEYKGEDYMGNKYYELSARPDVGRRKPSRWFESKNKDLMQEIPIEWESWLRNRRDNVPTNEEIIRNRAISEMKKKNDEKSKNKKHDSGTPHTSGERDFGTQHSGIRYPRREDLEIYPGQHRKDES